MKQSSTFTYEVTLSNNVICYESEWKYARISKGICFTLDLTKTSVPISVYGLHFSIETIGNWAFLTIDWNDFIAMKLHNFHSVYKTTHM